MKNSVESILGRISHCTSCLLYYSSDDLEFMAKADGKTVSFCLYSNIIYYS